MVRGNAVILNHQKEGRTLRVFWGVGGVVQYTGEFRLNAEAPWYLATAKETGSQRQRKVITFRLVSTGKIHPNPAVQQLPASG